MGEIVPKSLFQQHAESVAENYPGLSGRHPGFVPGGFSDFQNFPGNRPYLHGRSNPEARFLHYPDGLKFILKSHGTAAIC